MPEPSSLAGTVFGAVEHAASELRANAATPYLKEAVFEPKAIEALGAAFDAVCKSLQLLNRHGPITEIVARKIIDITRTCEHDHQRTHDLVLLELKEPDQRSA